MKYLNEKKKKKKESGPGLLWAYVLILYRIRYNKKNFKISLDGHCNLQIRWSNLSFWFIPIQSVSSLTLNYSPLLANFIAHLCLTLQYNGHEISNHIWTIFLSILISLFGSLCVLVSELHLTLAGNLGTNFKSVVEILALL
jgi:hypothetical protein